MTQITLEDAQLRLPELIAGLKPGQELQIVKDETPIARIVGEAPRLREPRVPGGAIGLIKIIEEDDAHLEDFKEYMP